ncbi:MAG TPA: hypothetical protein VGP72_01845 [Planctomycetota bacterium]
MANRVILAAVLALGLGGTAFAATEANKEDSTITVKGILQEDKNGFFLSADGVIYDVRINNESKADMHKFYTGLEGDLVEVSGVLHTEVADNKPYMILYSNDITRLKGERVPVAQRPVREVYVEHPHSSGIDVPFVHIHW